MAVAAPSVADTGTVRRVLATDAGNATALAGRARSLRGLAHEAVLAPVAVDVDEEGRVVATLPLLRGTDLRELEMMRGPLSAAECVWLGMGVGQALAAMHAAGLAHGDIAPANVLLTDGRVVLVDTMAGGLNDEWGTAGFRAPERREGATAAGDVYALGALLRWAVAEDARVRLDAWTAPMIASDPDDRPPVDVAVRALASCAEPAPIDVPPELPVVDTLRTRARERTERIREGRAHRARQFARRASAVVAGCAMAGGLAVLAPKAVDAAIPAPQPHFDPPMPIPASAAVSASEAAAHLTEERFEALANGDGARLMAIVDGGPLESETAELAAALDAREVSYADLSVTVATVDVLSEAGSRATVVIEYEVSPHTVVRDGEAQAVDGYVQRVAMDLSWSDRWVVQRVRSAA